MYSGFYGGFANVLLLFPLIQSLLGNIGFCGEDAL